jgi:glycosyltransferase involved in cell wall biosynthesis
MSHVSPPPDSPSSSTRPPGRGPLVSVVVPNLNKGRFIGEAIESVLAQSYKNLEVIVVDNGSEDQSVPVVEDMAQKDKRVSLFTEGTRGVSYAINAGIRKAGGELVTVVGSDDVLHREKIREQVQCLEGHYDSLCYTGGWYMDEHGKPLDRPPARDTRKVPTRNEGHIFHELVSNDFWNDFFGASIMYPKDCFRGRLFDTSLSYGEDWDFCVRISRSFFFRYLPEPLYGYRVYSGNTWAEGNEKDKLRNKIRLFEGWLKELRDVDKEDRKVILRQLLQAREELQGHMGLVRVAIAHPETSNVVLRRARSSITYRMKKNRPSRDHQ